MVTNKMYYEKHDVLQTIPWAVLQFFFKKVYLTHLTPDNQITITHQWGVKQACCNQNVFSWTFVFKWYIENIYVRQNIANITIQHFLSIFI